MSASKDNPFFIEFKAWLALLDKAMPLIEGLFTSGYHRHQPVHPPPEHQDQWLRDIPQRGRPVEDIIHDLGLKLNQDGSNSWSGRLFGHIPSGAAPITAIADLISSVANRYTGLLAGSRGGVAIHNDLVQWFGQLFGLGPQAWGSIQGGGSLATLTAIVAARDARPRARWGTLVVYLTDQAHGCVLRALHIAGISPAQIRQVQCDGAQRMCAIDLSNQIRQDRQAGRDPWLLVATAGTTNTGAVDPLASLAAIANSENLWLHVDAAYGGPFILTAAGAARLRGIEAADSVVVDPHKGLFVPFGVGIVLARRKSDLERAFRPLSPYIQDDPESKELSPYYYSPELSQQFRSLRLWFTLQFHGHDVFAQALQQRLDWTRWAYQQLAALPGIDVLEPQLTILAFRLQGSDDNTRALLETILQRGRITLSLAVIDGQDWIRACILHVNTTFDTVKILVEEITTCVDQHPCDGQDPGGL